MKYLDFIAGTTNRWCLKIVWALVIADFHDYHSTVSTFNSCLWLLPNQDLIPDKFSTDRWWLHNVSSSHNCKLHYIRIQFKFQFTGFFKVVLGEITNNLEEKKRKNRRKLFNRNLTNDNQQWKAAWSFLLVILEDDRHLLSDFLVWQLTWS